MRLIVKPPILRPAPHMPWELGKPCIHSLHGNQMYHTRAGHWVDPTHLRSEPLVLQVGGLTLILTRPFSICHSLIITFFLLHIVCAVQEHAMCWAYAHHIACSCTTQST